MTYWFSDYHHMLLLRLLSMAVVFGVLWPVLWLLITIGVRSAGRLARQWHGAGMWHGHTP
jgi:uncharacterized protein involved in response to NO